MGRVPLRECLSLRGEGTALVGAFGTGAQLYDREAANIRISENHEDFFTRNAIVVLAEERLALAVKRPESFVKVTFDAAAWRALRTTSADRIPATERSAVRLALRKARPRPVVGGKRSSGAPRRPE